jgi:hypothetical protein
MERLPATWQPVSCETGGVHETEIPTQNFMALRRLADTLQVRCMSTAHFPHVSHRLENVKTSPGTRQNVFDPRTTKYRFIDKRVSKEIIVQQSQTGIFNIYMYICIYIIYI